MSKSLRERYFETFTQNCLDAVELTRRKNLGYTGGTDDPFSNFRFAAHMATVPTKDDVTVAQTILSRMADKISRFKSLTVRPDAAFDEAMTDTLRDLFVYANILLTWEQLGHPEPGVTIDDGSPTVPVENLPSSPLNDVLKDSIPTPPNVMQKLRDAFNWK